MRNIVLTALLLCLCVTNANACDRYVTGEHSFDLIYEPVRLIRDERDRSYLVTGCGTGISGMCAFIPGKPETAFQFDFDDETLEALGRTYRCVE